MLPSNIHETVSFEAWTSQTAAKTGRIKIWCCRCWSLAGPQIARAVHDGPVVARQLECLGALFSTQPHSHGGKAVLVYFELEVSNSFFLFCSFISFVFICIDLL